MDPVRPFESQRYALFLAFVSSQLFIICWILKQRLCDFFRFLLQKQNRLYWLSLCSHLEKKMRAIKVSKYLVYTKIHKIYKADAIFCFSYLIWMLNLS